MSRKPHHKRDRYGHRGSWTTCGMWSPIVPMVPRAGFPACNPLRFASTDEDVTCYHCRAVMSGGMGAFLQASLNHRRVR